MAMTMALLAVGSCQKDDDVSKDAGAESLARPEVFEADVLALEDAFATKSSLLTSPDVETKLSNIVLAFYEGGVLYDTGYYTSSFSSMSKKLVAGKTYNIYAAANMGDVRASFPERETEVSGFSYSIPSYTAVNSTGIPMAGKKEGYVSGSDGDRNIPLTRLLAKVSVNITCTWENPRIGEVRIFNMNKTLKPFGTSVVASASDVLSFQDYETATGVGTYSAVLYVPENMQGTIAGIADSFHKTNDQGNASVSGKAALLTYMQTKVSSTSTYSGDVYYRSYLGNNITTNFDIKRNTHYVWNLTYTEDGLQYNDWKHDTGDLTGTRYRYSLSPTSQELYVNQTGDWQLMRYTDTYAAGTWTPGTTPSALPGTDYSYTVADETIATAAAANANTQRTTAHKKGSTNINVTVAGNTLTLPVEVRDMITHELEVYSSPDPASVSVGQTVTLTAKYYTLTNGVRDSGQDVTQESGTVWSRLSGASTVSVNNVIPNKGKVTATAGGTAVIQAKYNDLTGSKEVTFGDVVETRYRIELYAPKSTLAWNETSTFVVRRYKDTYRNGGRETTGTVPETMSADDFLWTSSVSGVASVNNAGTVTGVSGGSSVITATMKDSVADRDKYDRTSVTATVTVTNVTSSRLVLSADYTTRPYNGTINLTARYYKTTNGLEDAGTNVVPVSINKVSGGSNITITAGNPSVARLTNQSLSVEANNKADVNVVYDGVTSNTVSIAFTNGESYSYTRLVVTGDASVNVGSATGNYTATLYTQKCVNGIPSGSESSQDVSGSVTFTSSASGIVSISGRKATGVAAGTTYIGAKFSGTYGEITSADGDRQKLVVNDVVTHRLTLTVDNASKNYNETINLIARWYTTTNGSEDGGVVVTPESISMVSGGSNISLTKGNPSTAKLTTPSLSVVANNKGTVRATYQGETADLAIEFKNVTTYAYTRLVVNGQSSVNVGATTSDYTATLYTQTCVNGATSGSASTSDVSASASFSSSAIAIATMSGRKATGKAAGTTYIAAGYSGTYGNISSANADRVTLVVQNAEEDKYRIVISPASSSIAWNATQAYTVNRYTDHYVNGTKTSTGTTPTAMAASDFSWSSSSTSVATVSNGGVATGVSGGTATITATLKSGVTGYDKYTVKSVSATLTVTDVWSISLSPASKTETCGTNIILTPTVRRNGTVVTSGFTINWSSSNNNIARVTGTNSSATVSSYNGGTATITATVNGASATSSVTFIAEKTEYAADPTSFGMYLGGYGESYHYVRLKKTVSIFSNGVWSSGASTYVPVADYTLTDLSDKIFNITISGTSSYKVESYHFQQASGRTGSGTLRATVTADGATVDIPYVIYETDNSETWTYALILTADGSSSGASATVGSTITLKAVFKAYKNNSLVSSTDVTYGFNPSAQWQRAGTTNRDLSPITISNDLATSSEAVTMSIEAYYNAERSNAVTLTFTDAPHTYGLEVLPSTASVTVGGTQQFQAYLVTDGVRPSTPLTSGVTWSSTAAATISGSGLAMGASAGTATITASYAHSSGTLTDTATLTVTQQDTYSLVVKPVNPSVQVGNTQQFQAYLVTNGVESSTPLTSGVTWSSGTTSVATISGSGLASGASVGTAIITARYTPSGSSEVSGNTTLTVTAAPVTHTYSIVVEFAQNPIGVGSANATVASAYLVTDGDLSTKTLITDASKITWTSQTTSVATAAKISSGTNAGKATITGVAAGTSKITAQYSDGSISATGDNTITVNSGGVEIDGGWDTN